MADGFRERALHEAGRYGPDPWIFVRELLQNSRDAGATRVELRIEVDGDIERITCRDDGEGMTLEHARTYLFTLYASSKESQSNQAGRFGVGFWSVLRFQPTQLTVRSQPAHGEAWEIALDGSLEHAERRGAPDMPPGTEVVLERKRIDNELARRVHDAAYQSARYLRQRDQPHAALAVRVNGRPVNAPFSLPAPSVAFRRGGFRGVIGLGPAPRVELFSRGLRVRSAATLQDLLSAKGRHTDRSRVHFPDLPSGLAPQAILESADLEVLLSRGDVRDNRALRKLVRRAHQELTRLVRRQLSINQPWWIRAWDDLRDRVGGVALGFILGALLAVPLVWWILRDVPIGEQIRSTFHGDSAWTLTSDGNRPPPSPQPYSDIASAYQGPQVDVFPSGSVPTVQLTYTPIDESPRFVALVVNAFDSDGVPQLGSTLGEYRGVRCMRECIDVELNVATPGGPVRVPVPTGHVLDPSSLTWDGQPIEVTGGSPNREPVLVFKRAATGTLRYRTGPAAIRTRGRAVKTDLPLEAQVLVNELRRRPRRVRVRELTDFVRAQVEYANTAEVAEQHERARRNGQPFVDRALDIGAGDCDVQNGVLTILLQSAGVPARLVIGYIGRSGTVAPQLHAWVEYDDGSGLWRIADASEGAAPVLTSQATPIPRATPVEPPIATPEDGAVTASVTPAVGTAVRPTRSGTSRPVPGFMWLVGVGLILVGFGLVVPQVITRRRFHLDERQDATDLLKGAMQRPEAFRHISAIFHSRLVPVIGSRNISLLQAWDLAASGRLYRSDGSTDLGRRAAKRLRVLDDTQPEGRAVAVSLGAVDLDYWDTLLARSSVPPLFARLNRYLKRQGETWALRLGSGLGELVLTIDATKRGVLATGLTRFVLVDSSAPWLHALAERLGDTDPLDSFTVLDAVLDRIDMPPERRAELLAPLAQASIESGRTP